MTGASAPRSAPATAWPAAGPADHSAFPCLDGMRALAVTLVFAYHGILTSGPLQRYLLDQGAARAGPGVHLDVGVEIFFVLSGFLVYRPFAAAHLRRRARPALGAYAKRRALRIYPAYVVALSVLWAFDRIAITDWSWFLRHATLTQGYWGGVESLAGLEQSWTLAVEVAFYVFVPLWAALVRTVGGRTGAARAEVGAAVVAIGIGLFATWRLRFGAPPLAARILPPALMALGVGMLLTVLHLLAPTRARLAAALDAVGRHPAVCWAAGGAAFALLSSLSYRFNAYLPGQRLRQDVLQVVVAALLVLPAVVGAQEAGRIRQLLRWRPVVYVGTVSYGIYLWHFGVLDAIGGRALSSHAVTGALVLLALAYLISVGIATLSWYVIERPALRLARRPWIRGRQTPAARPT